MKIILILGTTVAVVGAIVWSSHQSRETQLMQLKLQQLQDRFRSLDQVSEFGVGPRAAVSRCPNVVTINRCLENFEPFSGPLEFTEI
jgi:hypothetical protein